VVAAYRKIDAISSQIIYFSDLFKQLHGSAVYGGFRVFSIA